MFDETEEKLRDILAKGLKVDPTKIEKTSKLAEWGGDSLDFIDTVFAIETQFDITLPDVGGGRDLDFQTLADMIKEQLAAKK